MADSNKIRTLAYHKANQFIEQRVQTMGDTLMSRYPAMDIDGLTEIQIHIIDVLADYYAVNMGAKDADVEKYISAKFGIRASIDTDPYPFIQSGTVQ